MVAECLVHGISPYHMLPARHHPLVDNLGRIVSSRVYMHTLLHHRIAPCAQGFPSFVPAWLDLGLSGHCHKVVDWIKAIELAGSEPSPEIDGGSQQLSNTIIVE